MMIELHVRYRFHCEKCGYTSKRSTKAYATLSQAQHEAKHRMVEYGIIRDHLKEQR